MKYTATISSKGQITIPIEARRKLGLGKIVSINLEKNRLVISQHPSIEDIRRILNAPSKGKTMSKGDIVSPWAQAAVKKDMKNRGY